MNGKRFDLDNGGKSDEQNQAFKRAKIDSQQQDQLKAKTILACTALRIVCQKWMVESRLSFDISSYSSRQTVLREELLANYLSYKQTVAERRQNVFQPEQIKLAFLQNLDNTYDICDAAQAQYLGLSLATQMRNIPQLLPTATQLAGLSAPVSTALKQ